jgi:hypothetical protein
MSRFTPLLVHSVGSARFVNQMSQQIAFAPQGGRGRKLSARRRVQGALGVPMPDEVAFRDFWAGLMARRCGCAAGVAQMFGCTEQTGRNWLAGASCPIGHAVWHAMDLWPDDFGIVARAA